MANERMTGEQVAQNLSDFVNIASTNELDNFVKEISADHPELQNRIFMLFMQTTKQLATKDDTDSRNKHAVNTSKRIVDLLSI